jgi:predicted site-specific integrase-resolvase
MSFVQHYTVPTVAQRLNLSMKTIWRWIRAGRFGEVHQVNGRYFISHPALERVLGSSVGPAPAAAEPVVTARCRGEFKRKVAKHFP